MIVCFHAEVNVVNDEVGGRQGKDSAVEGVILYRRVGDLEDESI